MLDLLSAAPKVVRFGNRTLRVGALKLRELGLLQRFIRDHTERPTAALKASLEFHPADDHARLKAEALAADAHWPPAVGTLEGNQILFGSEEGQRHFLGVMLRKYQPDLDDAFLEEVMGGVSEEDLGVLASVAFGEDDVDPEAIRSQARARLAALKAALSEAGNPAASTSGSSTTTTSTTPLT